MAVDEKPNVQVPGSPALDTVKLDIRTIMANYSSNLISLNQLLREYEQTIGTKLPFRQFGYDSPMQFFQSLPDLVQIVEGARPLLSLVELELPGRTDSVSDQKLSNLSAPVERKPPPRVYPQPINAYPHCYPQQFFPMPMTVPPYPFYTNAPKPFAPASIFPSLPQPMFVPPINSWHIPQKSYSSWQGCQKPINSWQGPPYPFSNYQGAPVFHNWGRPPMIPHSTFDVDHLNDPTDDKKPAITQLPDTELPTTIVKSEDVPEESAEEKKTLEDKCPDYTDVQESDWIPVTVKIRGCVSSRAESLYEPAADQSPVLPKYDRVVNQKYGSITIRKHAGIRMPSKCNTSVNSCLTDEFFSVDGTDNGSLKINDGAPSVRSIALSESLKPDVQGYENENLPPLTPQRGLTEEIKANIKSLLSQNPRGIAADLFVSLYEELYSKPLDFAACGYSHLKDLIVNNEDVILFTKSRSSDDWTLYDAETSQILMGKRSKVPSSKWIPYSVTDNMATLVGKFKDGIDMGEVLQLYKKEFGTEINLKDIGFDSPVEFFRHCKSVKLVVLGNRNIVYPHGWFSNPDKFPEPLIDLFKLPASLPAETTDYVRNDLFKDYECDPSFKYLPPVIPNGLIHPVKLVDVYSPASVYLQFVQSIGKLKKLMRKLNSFYKKEHQMYSLDEGWVMPGLAVAALFKFKWHRAVVTEVQGQTIGLTYVDFGTVSTTSLADIRKLDRRFSEDPMYAVSASLFCIIPANGETWSEESYNFLYNYYSDQLLFAEIFNVNYAVPSVEVNLYLTAIDKEVNVSDQLVKYGLAAYAVDPALVINKNLLSRVGGFFPWWFRYSNSHENDPNAFIQNILHCSSNTPHPLEPEDRPCCLSTIVFKFFRSKPGILMELWSSAMLSVADDLIKYVIASLGDAVSCLGWDDCLTECKTFCDRHYPTVEQEGSSSERDTTCKCSEPQDNRSESARSSQDYPDRDRATVGEHFNPPQLAFESARKKRVPPHPKVTLPASPKASREEASISPFTTDINRNRRPNHDLKRFLRCDDEYLLHLPNRDDLYGDRRSDSDDFPDSLMDRLEKRRLKEGTDGSKPIDLHVPEDTSSLTGPSRCSPSRPVSVEQKKSLRNDEIDEMNIIFDRQASGKKLDSSAYCRRVDRTSESWPRSKKTFTPKVIRYVEIFIGSCNLIIFEYKDEFRVSISQLLLIPRITPLLIEHRLASTDKFIESIMAVSRDTDPDLYNDLLNLGLVPSERDELSDPLLVSLREAAGVLNVVDPLVDYSRVFSSIRRDLIEKGLTNISKEAPHYYINAR